MLTKYRRNPLSLRPTIIPYQTAAWRSARKGSPRQSNLRQAEDNDATPLPPFDDCQPRHGQQFRAPPPGGVYTCNLGTASPPRPGDTSSDSIAKPLLPRMSTHTHTLAQHALLCIQNRAKAVGARKKPVTKAKAVGRRARKRIEAQRRDRHRENDHGREDGGKNRRLGGKGD